MMLEEETPKQAIDTFETRRKMEKQSVHVGGVHFGIYTITGKDKEGRFLTIKCTSQQFENGSFLDMILERQTLNEDYIRKYKKAFGDHVAARRKEIEGSKPKKKKQSKNKRRRARS